MGHPSISLLTAAGYQGDRCHETGHKRSGRPLFYPEAVPGTASRSVGLEPVGLKTVEGRALRPGLLASSPYGGDDHYLVVQPVAAAASAIHASTDPSPMADYRYG